MSETARAMGSVYIEWAKTLSQARFNLATSGIMNYPISEFPLSVEDLDLSGPSWYGYEPLQQALASKCRVEPDSVVHATGTSMANHLAMAAMLERGDEALIEHPAYDPLVSTAHYLGASVKRFKRRFEDGFLIDAGEVERALSTRTRLIVLTNLHNPTGALEDNDTLRRIGEIARSAGARVLVDEVYLELMFDRSQGSAFKLGEEFVVTGSLTKAYGLSGLRCGWVLAEPQLAKKMWRLNDLFGNIASHASERLSVIALQNLERIGARAKSLLGTNRAALNSFLDSREDLEAVRPKFGTVAFPRLKRGSVDALVTLLGQKYETTVVPGRFFEMPDHFRIGVGCNTEMLVGGLERLAKALDEFPAASAPRL
jgi:aspartate/methionine/tyrosine aminotransferase